MAANESAGLENAGQELLDGFLSSDRVPDGAMSLSALDGFLTGIAIGPELILPSEWLPIVWGGEELPEFADEAEANAVLGAIMDLYNDILRQVADGTPSPIFWVDTDDMPLPQDWTEAFMEAVGLRVKAWEPLLQSKSKGHLIYPILAFCDDEDGKPIADLTYEEMEKLLCESTELISRAVIEIAAYWGRRGGQVMPPPSAPARSAPKIGRNDPCPCGSGKKYKKCCGQAN